ncbi:MAG: sulfatase, partial [Deltaproteobacteria bacterium]|nr:sulfatase [Deltaproteobacteria bacterium]MBW2724153.1 sulfatase [Deltaproteobacteria bacterium]
YPRETSPFLDRLAREGARFEHAVAPSSRSLPSLVTLLTALPPEQHGVVRADLALDDSALTLAEVLADRGFATAAFVTGPELAATRGLAQGFETYVETRVERQVEDQSENATPASVGGLTQSVTGPNEWLNEWDQSGRRAPFLLFVHLPLLTRGDEFPPTPTEEMRGPENPGPTEIERAIARYDDAIRRADHELGQIVQLLDSLELRQETLVIVTSNHGEEFLERGNLGHGRTLYGESVRVPLIVRFPSRLDAGKVIPEPARLMDIGPTVMMLARVRRPLEFGFLHEAYGFSMRDLTELLLGEPSGRNVVLPGDLAEKFQSLRLGSYKLIRNLALDEPERYEYFNLDLDPDELNDIFESERKRAGFMIKQLDAWREICADRQHYARPHQPAGE